MRIAYLSVPLAILLVSFPALWAGISSAESNAFGLYDTGSDPEQGHDGPIISGTVDFEITYDIKLRLPKGTVLSDDEIYMRMDSEERVPYRIGINISGLKGFALDCGITFEFYSDKGCNEFVTSVTLYEDGTAYSRVAFSSGVDYHIRAVTSREIVIDSLPDPVDGMKINFDVTVDESGQTVIEDRTGERIIDVGDGKAIISMSDIAGKLDTNGSLTVLIGDFMVRLDHKAMELLLSKTKEIIRIWIETLETDDSSPFGRMYEMFIECDEERITSLNDGKASITTSYDSGNRVMGALVKSISTNGRTSVCDSEFDYDSSTLRFDTSGCYMYSVEPYDGSTGNNSENESNGTGMILALPIAIIVAMILLPLVLKWRGKI